MEHCVTHIAMGGVGRRKGLLSYTASMSSSYRFFTQRTDFRLTVIDVARMGEERGVYRVLVGKPEGKRPLGRPRRRWVDNIRMDLREVGCGYMDWIGLA